MTDDTQQVLRKAGKRYARATAARDRARDDLAAAVRAAVDSGLDIKTAAREAGVTRATVYAWLGRRADA